jgi:hypothetical protein
MLNDRDGIEAMLKCQSAVDSHLHRSWGVLLTGEQSEPNDCPVLWYGLAAMYDRKAELSVILDLFSVIGSGLPLCFWRTRLESWEADSLVTALERLLNFDEGFELHLSEGRLFLKCQPANRLQDEFPLQVKWACFEGILQPFSESGEGPDGMLESRSGVDISFSGYAGTRENLRSFRRDLVAANR